MSNIAIIPARSGSKGLPDKNIKKLADKPLMAYTIDAAIRSGVFDTVMVSTDSDKYAQIAREYGAEVPFMRSEDTSSDSASSWDMVEEVLSRYEEMGRNYDAFCLLQPTSPMRIAEDIRAAFKLYNEKNAVSVLSMTELEHPIEWCGKIDETLSLEKFKQTVSIGCRQDMEKYYRPNGAIYIVSVEEFRKDRNLYRAGSYAYIMPQERSVDIDTEEDFRLAEYLMGRGEPLRITETPFQFIEEDPLIACVGDNGGTSDYDIFEGFVKAVTVIYDFVARNRLYEDVMVYPMAFSARHGIELGLKISIQKLKEFLDLDKLESRIVDLDRKFIETVLLEHNIKDLRDCFVSLLAVDKRLVLYDTNMTPYISDYYFDEKGDMFRYANSREEVPNLASQSIAHVGLTQLYSRFSELVKYFEKFYPEAEIIYEEYKTGSYTKSLSRKDINNIAEKLPETSVWTEEAFDGIRSEIKNEYDISSRELSDAINIIKSVPEFSVKIGVEKKYKDIPDKELDSYWKLVEWYSSKENSVPDTISLGGVTVETINAVQQNLRGTSEYAKDISTETLNILMVFFIIADEDGYVEDIEKYFSYIQKCKYDRDYLVRKLARSESFHLVKIGMEMCGQKSYLKRINYSLV